MSAKEEYVVMRLTGSELGEHSYSGYALMHKTYKPIEVANNRIIQKAVYKLIREISEDEYFHPEILIEIGEKNK